MTGCVFPCRRSRSCERTMTGRMEAMSPLLEERGGCRRAPARSTEPTVVDPCRRRTFCEELPLIPFLVGQSTTMESVEVLVAHIQGLFRSLGEVFYLHSLLKQSEDNLVSHEAQLAPSSSSSTRPIHPHPRLPFPSGSIFI